MKILMEMMSYPFLVRALIVGVLVSLCAALLGTSRAFTNWVDQLKCQKSPFLA